jgi:hypothetical protein
MFLAAAIIGSAVVGAVGSSAAANTQSNADQAAAQTQQNMFNTITANNKPYMNAGNTALNQLMYGLGDGGAATTPTNALPGGGTSTSAYMPTPGGGVQRIMGVGGAAPTTGAAIRPGATGPAGGSMGGVSAGQFTSGFTPADLTANLSPGYGFQLATGGQAIRNADTPTQGALSGGSLKDLMSFNQGLASTSYQQAYNNWNTTNNTIFGRLSGIAGLGQNAATNVGTAGTTLGTGAAQAGAAAGAAQAGGIVGATNALGGAASSVPLSYMMAGNTGTGSFGAAGNNTGLTSGNLVAGVNVGGD